MNEGRREGGYRGYRSTAIGTCVLGHAVRKQNGGGRGRGKAWDRG